MAATQPQRWSTLAAALARQFAYWQFAYWRELICEAFLGLTPESDLGDGFSGTITQWPFGEPSLARIDSQRQQVRRTDRDIARAARRLLRRSVVPEGPPMFGGGAPNMSQHEPSCPG